MFVLENYDKDQGTFFLLWFLVWGLEHGVSFRSCTYSRDCCPAKGRGVADCSRPVCRRRRHQCARGQHLRFSLGRISPCFSTFSLRPSLKLSFSLPPSVFTLSSFNFSIRVRPMVGNSFGLNMNRIVLHQVHVC